MGLELGGDFACKILILKFKNRVKTAHLVPAKWQSGNDLSFCVLGAVSHSGGGGPLLIFSGKGPPGALISAFHSAPENQLLKSNSAQNQNRQVKLCSGTRALTPID